MDSLGKDINAIIEEPLPLSKAPHADTIDWDVRISRYGLGCYIHATGGHSKNKSYLKLLQNKVLQ